MFFQSNTAYNILRPEFVESLYHMSCALPHKRKLYQKWGWKVFQAIEKNSKTPNGYSSVQNVDSIDARFQDSMETFFVAETLKYLYLLFSNPKNVAVDLKNYVLNTEAHFIPIRRKIRHKKP